MRGTERVNFKIKIVSEERDRRRKRRFKIWAVTLMQKRAGVRDN